MQTSSQIRIIGWRLVAAGCLLLLGLSIAGCVSRPLEGAIPVGRTATHDPVAELRKALLALGPEVAFDEAYRVAATAFIRSSQLAEEYDILGPARIHNMFVNAGLRDRGLCYHWADDMQAALDEMPLFTLEVQRVVARRDTLREHNAVAITAKDQPIEEGIVLDSWRDSGRLYWGPLIEDKFPWTLFVPNDDPDR